MAKVPIAVVSPFVDKRHGTERCLAEQIERLAKDYEIHLYSSRVEDLDTSRLIWHRVPEIAGPHLIKYIWWFAANHFYRRRESARTGEKFHLVYSPGINCWDANVILVHHVFTDHRERLRERLRLRFHRIRDWPRQMHRRLFYQLIGWLECRIYRRPAVVLAAISRSVAADLEQRFRPGQSVATIYHGVDTAKFNPEIRLRERDQARHRLGFRNEDFVILLIGNDWEKKGLPCLIDSLAMLYDLPVSGLIVGNDRSQPFRDRARQRGVDARLHFAHVSPDVQQFYAAADVCVAPSLYDPFGLPVLEAMACGLPVVASRSMGASELITDGENGLILDHPQDAALLATMIRKLYADSQLCRRLEEAASLSARNFTWEANAAAVAQLFEQLLICRKQSEGIATQKQESRQSALRHLK